MFTEELNQTNELEEALKKVTNLEKPTHLLELSKFKEEFFKQAFSLKGFDKSPLDYLLEKFDTQEPILIGFFDSNDDFAVKQYVFIKDNKAVEFTVEET